jgi:hypothetical protein
MATQIKAQDLFPGDVIRWEQLGADTTTCDVHRVTPEPDGRFALVIEARGQRPRTFIVPADLMVTRVY